MAGSISRNSTVPSCSVNKGTPAEYSAGLKRAIERGWLELHDSVKFTAAGADLFA
jgi:hypothetical protein